MRPGEYTIDGGPAEADRLSRQADVMAGASLTFLQRSGLKLGGGCVDVGCGLGSVSIVMARVVGQRGRVVGIDADPEALRIARSAADQSGVHVEFVCADANESIAGPPFDLAYCRLMLSHLIEPLVAVRIMRDAVRPGGVVAVEDLLTGTLRSEPVRPVLEELQNVYASTVRAHGGDPTIGPRLRKMLSAGGLQEVNERVVVNPMHSIAEKLFLSELIHNMRHSILEAGAATEVEIDSMVQRTEEAAREPSTVFYQAHIYQVSGRRPLLALE